MSRSRNPPHARFGDDYPDSVEILGIRMQLVRETRFHRFYHNDERNTGAVLARFGDGSADITLSELEETWPAWSSAERHDFTTAVRDLHDHQEILQIIRFILDVGGDAYISEIALAVASVLPAEEAFERLSAILDQLPIAEAANIIQAISSTGHPHAALLLRKRLRTTLEDPRLMEPDDRFNRVACDAISAIEHLLQIGASPSEFEQEVRRLTGHPSSRMPQILHRRLPKWYPWLSEPGP